MLYRLRQLHNQFQLFSDTPLTGRAYLVYNTRHQRPTRVARHYKRNETLHEQQVPNGEP